MVTERMERNPEISIRLFSDPHLLSTIRSTVEGLAKVVGFAEKSRGLLMLAIDEALANVIRHGYDGRTDEMIWVHLWRVREPRGIRIIIEDLGRSVAPEKIKGRDLSDVKPGGLGVHIIKETMNESCWEQRPEGGMRLTLVKWLSPEELQNVTPTKPENTFP